MGENTRGCRLTFKSKRELHRNPKVTPLFQKRLARRALQAVQTKASPKRLLLLQ